jgi:6-phosphogluconolactonase
MTGEMTVISDPTALTRYAAEKIVEMSAAQPEMSIALSGGATPRALYVLLASADYARRIHWPGLHLFWGDERGVPPDHADSNYRMTREALLDHVPILPQNIHRMRGELPPAEAAQDYEHTLRAFFSDKNLALPQFDLLLLGMGDDGHTASLFPHTAALHEHERWVIENRVDKLDTWRITLTATALNAAANVWFLITGSGKAAVLHQVLHGPFQPDLYPSQMVQPTAGRLHWLVDAAAAARL